MPLKGLKKLAAFIGDLFKVTFPNFTKGKVAFEFDDKIVTKNSEATGKTLVKPIGVKGEGIKYETTLDLGSFRLGLNFWSKVQQITSGESIIVTVMISCSFVYPRALFGDADNVPVLYGLDYEPPKRNDNTFVLDATDDESEESSDDEAKEPAIAAAAETTAAATATAATAAAAAAAAVAAEAAEATAAAKAIAATAAAAAEVKAAADADAYNQRVRESVAQAEADASYRARIVAAYDDEADLASLDLADAHDALVATYPPAKKARTAGTSAIGKKADSKNAAVVAPAEPKKGAKKSAKKTAKAKAASPVVAEKQTRGSTHSHSMPGYFVGYATKGLKFSEFGQESRVPATPLKVTKKRAENNTVRAPSSKRSKTAKTAGKSAEKQGSKV